MNRLKLLYLLILLLLLPSSSHAQGSAIVGQPCGASGLSTISTTGVPVVCLGNPPLWTSPSGSGGGVGITLTPTITASPQCNGGVPGNVGNCYFVNDDTQFATNATFNATTTVTVATPFFTAGMVGKHIAAFATCATDTGGYVSEFGTTATTITAFTSSTSVTVSGATSGSVAGTGCIWVGTPDDSNVSAIDAAIGTFANTCPTVVYPMGVMWLSSPGHLSTNAPGCPKTPAGNGLSAVGGWGLHVTGAGISNTIFFIDNTMNVLTGCVGGCFAPPIGTFWEKFTITGGGNPASGAATNNSSIVNMGNYFQVRDFECSNIGQSSTTANQGSNFTGVGIAGMRLGQFGGLANVDLDGCGALGAYAPVNASIVTNNFNPQDSPVEFAEDAGGYITMRGGNFLGSGQVPANGSFVLIANASLYLDPGEFFVLNGDGNIANGIKCLLATCIIHACGAQVTMNGGATANVGVNDGGVATDLYLEGGNFQGGSAGNGIKFTSASSRIFDNVAKATINPALSNSGSFFGSSSATGNPCVTGNWALTSGWGTSSIASVTAGGDSHRCQIVITGAAGSASPVLTWTFPTVYFAAPGSCQISFNGTLTGESSGAPSTTAVAFTFTGTPSAQTYRLDASCGP